MADPPLLGVAAPEETATSLSVTVADEPRLSYDTPVTLGTLKVNMSGQPNSLFDVSVNGAFLTQGDLGASGEESFMLPVYEPGETLFITINYRGEQIFELIQVEPYRIDVKPVITEGYLKARATADMLNYAGKPYCPNGWAPDSSGSRCTKDFTMQNGRYRVFVTPWLSQYFDTQKREAYTLTVHYKNGKQGEGNFLELGSDVRPGLIEYNQPLSACLTGLSAQRPYPAPGSWLEPEPPELPDNPEQMDYGLCVPIDNSSKDRADLELAQGLDAIKLFYYTVRPSDGLVQLHSSGGAVPSVIPWQENEYSQKIHVLFPVVSSTPLIFQQPEA